METKGKKRTITPEMPFQVNRKLNVDITTQVTDGLREAILTGFYKPGDVLPKIMEFTRGLHVSLRPLLPAYRALKREGLILYDPARDADAIADALLAYLDTGAVPGTISLENTFVAGEPSTTNH